MQRALGSVLALASAASAVLVGAPARAQTAAVLAQPSFEYPGPVGIAKDRWSKRITWRAPDGWYAVGVHATVLPDGRVHFIGFDRDAPGPGQQGPLRRSAFTLVPTPLGQDYPDEVIVTPQAQPIDADMLFVDPYVWTDTLFCAGHTLTAEGELFTAGGTRSFSDAQTGVVVLAVGLSYATLFDPATDAWTRVAADMLVADNWPQPVRWYPTATRLPDERILVTAGSDYVQPVQTPNLSAEIWDPVTGGWQVLSPAGEPPPEIYNRDYSHVFVLPRPVASYDLLVFGEAGLPVLLSTTSTPRWVLLPRPRPGAAPGTTPNHGTSTALLPLRVQDGEWGYANGAVIQVGGAHATVHERTADVFDPSTLSWIASIDIGVRRHHPTAVLLPDGRVLVAAGHDQKKDPNVKRATYVDPAAGFAVAFGSASTREMRGYHSVAVLLPDGRVLVGGGQDAYTGGVPEKSNFRYLHPSYLFEPRPEIQEAPGTVPYAADFVLTTAGPEPAEVVLLALPSMTHSFDFDQRYVQLAVKSVVADGPRHTVTATGPPDGRAAPTGPYMLLVLDERRVPSVAEIVRVR